MHKTTQEDFWAGEFGREYSSRNVGENIIANNVALFSKIARNFRECPKSIMEYGSNIGLNILALKTLFPSTDFSCVEINKDAAELLENTGATVYNESILEFIPSQKYDVTLVKGVLIHINPDFLSSVYELLYESSNRYIIIAEYYNPSPVVIKYRDHEDKLFKRDFAGELMDKYNDLKLVDYGFSYHRDNCFPQDDITWFLLEKPTANKAL